MANRYVVRNGKIYARVSYFDSTGKERQLWRRAQSRSETKDLADDLAHNIKQFGSETFQHQLAVGEYLDKWLKSSCDEVVHRHHMDFATLNYSMLRLSVTYRISKPPRSSGGQKPRLTAQACGSHSISSSPAQHGRDRRCSARGSLGDLSCCRMDDQPRFAAATGRLRA